MKLLSWNCRGLGSPSTVLQLKESLRLYKPELIFVCETKKKLGFVSTVCKKNGWGKRWFAVDPIGKSGGLLLGWSLDVIIHHIRSTHYSLEVDFEIPGSVDRMWAVFVYASNKEAVRLEQWQELINKKRDWGNNWVLGGDFNDIRYPSAKGRREESNRSKLPGV